MGAFLSTTVFGLLIVAMGIANAMGNITTLHWYHRQRVAKEDIKPFGRVVGFGTIICGASSILFGLAFLAKELTDADIFIWLGTAVLIGGMAAGITVALWAIVKYNKGLF